MVVLKKINMGDEKFLYRCEFCGYESHHSPVSERELGPPPSHRCKQSEKPPTFDDDITL